MGGLEPKKQSVDAVVNSQHSVIAVSGGISSGKSTLSTAISHRLNCPRASFGEYVRNYAQDEGLDESRTSLQEIGKLLVESDPKKFCNDVVAYSGWNPGELLVIDGIRHVEILDIVRELVAPQTLALVYVDTSSTVRSSRNAAKDEVSIDVLDAHSTEQEVATSLLARADMVLDGEATIPELLAAVLQMISAPA